MICRAFIITALDSAPGLAKSETLKSLCLLEISNTSRIKKCWIANSTSAPHQNYPCSDHRGAVFSPISECDGHMLLTAACTISMQRLSLDAHKPESARTTSELHPQCYQCLSPSSCSLQTCLYSQWLSHLITLSLVMQGQDISTYFKGSSGKLTCCRHIYKFERTRKNHTCLLTAKSSLTYPFHWVSGLDVF